MHLSMPFVPRIQRARPEEDKAGQAEQSTAPDCQKRPLLRRFRFRQQVSASVRPQFLPRWEKWHASSTTISPEETTMPQGRPPVSTTTRLYGHFAHQTEHRPQPVVAVVNALLDQRGVDALYVPLQVPAEHFTAALAGLRHLRDFAGFTVTMPHKITAARLCDALLPNAQACGAVNAVRVAPDGRLIGETF